MKIDENVMEFAEALKDQAHIDKTPADTDQIALLRLAKAKTDTEETENKTAILHAIDLNSNQPTKSEISDYKRGEVMDLLEKFKIETQSILRDQNSKIESMQLEINHLTKSNVDLKTEVATLTALASEMRNEITEIQENATKNKEKQSQNIQTLSKKIVEMKSSTLNLEKENESIQLKLHGHIEKYNDAIYCEKSGERLSQKQVNGLQEDIFVLDGKMEKNLKELENFKKQTHDKINHINQTIKNKRINNIAIELRPPPPPSLASQNAET